MIKKLTIYCSCLLALLFSGCAEDDWYLGPDQVPDRDYAEISLAVAQPQHVTTRAAYSLSDDISTATVLIYKGETAYSTSTLLQTAKFGYGGSEREGDAAMSLKVKYNDDVKNQLKNGSVYLFVVANRTYTTAPGSVQALLYDDKDGVAASDLVKQARNIVMTGSYESATPGDEASVSMADKAALNRGVNIAMRRDLARLDVTTDEAVENFVITSYNVWSAAPNAYTASGVSGVADATGFAKNSSGTVNSEEQIPSENPLSPNFVYAYPQPKPDYADSKDLNDPTKDNRAFVIVGGEYAGEPCFYRVDLRKKDENNKWVYLFLTANHQYDVTIKKVKSKGYASRELAAQNPQQDIIETEIHDHVPAVLSIASDGVRELGVPYEVELNSTTNSFSLSLYSKISTSEYPAAVPAFSESQKAAYTAENFSIEVIEGTEWLKLKSLDKLSNNESTDSDFTETSSNSGIGYHLTVSNISKYDMGTMTGKIRVTWCGLSREVNVKWVGTFDPTKICSASLKISGPSTVNNASITTTSDLCYTNYWDFLKSSSTYGVSSTANEGRIRNQGLHIPCYYGGSKEGDQWQYEYTLTLSNDVYKSGDEVTVTTNGMVFSANDLYVSSTEGNKIILKARSDSFGLRYFVGELVISVNGTELPPIDIYHTGFFHRVAAADDNTYKEKTPLKYEKKGDVGAGWYYYEVRSFGNRCWLDRNICAKATGMSILTQSGGVSSNYISDGGEFNNESIGGYFLPAKSEDYGDVNSNIYKTICPPGFRIPNTSEWDIIRNSFGFKNGMQIRDGKTYYEAKVEDMFGYMIYLPKVMYYHATENKIVGDARAGYYWTKSEAPGLEKKEIGHWMRALMLSGESSSYMHGDVEKYAMQVRAIDDADEEVSQTTIAFKVTGATHVYIYDAGEEYAAEGASSIDLTSARKKDAIKSGLMAWPGVAIGDPKTMRSNKSWYNPEYNRAATEYVFNYVTNSNKQDLRFVFNYVTDAGKIYTFSRRVDSGETGAAQYNGWPLAEVFKFGIDDLTSSAEQTFTTTVNGDVTETTSANYKTYVGTPVNIDSRPDLTYKFYVLKEPPYTTNNPTGFRLNVQEKASSSSYKTLVNNNWGGSGLTTKQTIDGKEYYIITYVTKESKWGFNFTYTWNNGANESGVTPKGSDAFKLENGVYVTTIYEMFQAQPGSPGNESYTYRLHGSIFDSSDTWIDKNLTQVAGTTRWEGEYTVVKDNGGFGIKQMNGTAQNAWYSADGTSSFGNTGGTLQCKKNGTNFSISKGTYKFSYDTSTEKLTVTPTSTPVTSDDYTIYYSNPQNWSNVYCYIIKNGATYPNTDNWPGKKMTGSGSNWTFSIPKDADLIIFNNNEGSKTYDIPVEKRDNVQYGKWDNKSYRIYVQVQSDSDNKKHNAFNSWYSGYGWAENVIIKGLFSDTSLFTRLEHNGTVYYYADFEQVNSPFNIKYQQVFGATGSGQDITGDFKSNGDILNTAFNFDDGMRHVYTVSGWNTGSGGFPYKD